MAAVFWTMGPVLALILLTIVPVGVFLRFQKRTRRHRRSPLVRDLLRGPGERLRRELDEITWDMALHLSLLLALPFIAYSVYLSQSHFAGVIDDAYRWLVGGVLLIAGMTYLAVRLGRLARKRFQLQQGLEGEIAVGQELNQLMRRGAIVYHDLPAEAFNIDHVLVAPSGLYAVETKSRLKPRHENRGEDAKVQFDGEALAFPNWKDTKSVAQAQRQGRWLEKWIASAVGEKIDVQAVLVLPGWYVERRGRGAVTVIGSGEIAKWFKDDDSGPLTPQLMQRIAHQLDAKCRDVRPSHSRGSTPA